MKAMKFERYGDPTTVLSLVDVAPPHIESDDGVVVRVASAALNPADWHVITGVPYIARAQMGLRPRTDGLGLDLAGVVEHIGPAVTDLVPGDRVFGMVGPAPGTSTMRLGAVAELVAVREGDLVRMPDGVGFDEAAAVGVAGTTALRGLTDVAGVGAGQRVLVNGASGGVGSFAVQIAVALGAEVVGVCSTPKVQLVRDLGARHVIDYTRDDASAWPGPVDVVLDNVGDRSPRTWRDVLAPDGTFVANFGRKSHRVVGPFGAMLAMAVLGRWSSQRFVMLPSRTDRRELERLAAMMAAGELHPVVGHTVDLVDAAAAMQLVADGHARGKIVVRVQGV